MVIIAISNHLESGFLVRLRRTQNQWGFQRGETKFSPVDYI